MDNGMSNIEHVVVLMMENRSFDNLLGWLYGPGKQPKVTIGPAGEYQGLTPNSFWNPSNPSFFKGAPPDKVYATEPTTGSSPFTVPTPDPEEDFDDMSFQIFGTSTPSQGQTPTMLGFLVNYQKANPSNPAHANTIMETYSPGQVSMLSGLASSYAVSDAWYASCPCQTWPNRAFVHTGTSNGRVNNWPYDPFDFDVPTIFNVLETCDKSWGVYSPTLFPKIMSLTRIQLPQLWSLSLDSRFRSIEDFLAQAAEGTLPAYSFLEPSFILDPNDQHPPYDVCLGDLYFQTIWSTLVNSPKWSSTLFIITYDEHGGCADHVPPPWGAATPDAASNPGEEGFTFNRFGVRVPTVLVSPWIQEGTVLRSETGVPYDHTSILATLRDWLEIPESAMLTSQRIASAPTFGEVLSASAPRTDVPQIAPDCTPGPVRLPDDAPLNDLQRSIVVGAARMLAEGKLADSELARLLAKVTTQAQAARYFESRHQT